MPSKILTGLSLATLLLLNTAYAQNPPTGIQDEGGTINYPAYVLDCVGAGIECTHSGSTATLTVSGSGSATITTQEQDVNVDASTGTIDFQECFDLTSSPAGEANVSFDSSECTVNANALKADGANCSAGEIPLGVDTAGAVQGCYEPAATDIASGTFADARIAESNVTQHEAALTITESQISDLNHTATAITDGLIVEADLNEDSGTPTDEDVLTYDSTGANFNWVAQSTLAAGTAAALAANGANCSAGSAPLGVSAAGAAESCTDFEEDLVNSAGLRAALSDEVGTGAAYFVGGALGTPASGNGSNLTALNATQLTSGTVPAARVGTAHIDSATEIGNDIVTHAQIADSDQADTKCFTFYESNGIDADDDLESVWANKTANDFLITEIWCETDTGTVTAMLQVDDGTPADVDTVDLACTSSETEDTSLNGDTTIAAGEELDWAVTSTATSPLFVRVCFTGNWVD